MVKVKNDVNKNLIIVILAIIAVILLIVIIGLLVYFFVRKNKKDPKPTTIMQPVINQPTVNDMVNDMVNDDNKVILINDRFIRYDPGLYVRPQSYPGVVHHGPRLVQIV